MLETVRVAQMNRSRGASADGLAIPGNFPTLRGMLARVRANGVIAFSRRATKHYHLLKYRSAWVRMSDDDTELLVTPCVAPANDDDRVPIYPETDDEGAVAHINARWIVETAGICATGWAMVQRVNRPDGTRALAFSVTEAHPGRWKKGDR